MTTIHEHFWDFACEWSLSAQIGAGERVPLAGRTGTIEIKTTGEEAVTPFPATAIKGGCTADLTFFLEHVDVADRSVRFAIDRQNDATKTPRRNLQVAQFIDALGKVDTLADFVQRYFSGDLSSRVVRRVHPTFDRLAAVTTKGVFPALLGMFSFEASEAPEAGGGQPALLEDAGGERKEGAAAAAVEGGLDAAVALARDALTAAGTSVSLSEEDFGSFIAEHRRTLALKVDEVTKLYPARACVTCDEGHALHHFEVPADRNHICDGCDGSFATGTSLRACRTCDFDLCMLCSAKRATAAAGEGQKEKEPDAGDGGGRPDGEGAATTANMLIASDEATLVGAMRVIAELADISSELVECVEAMLRSQLVAAIGKEIGAADFAEYMDFHHMHLFKEEYQPKGFSYAVRRPDHFPDGIVSIENRHDNQPIRTMVMRREAVRPMKFALNAATDVQFGGDRYLHASVLHQFANTSPADLVLTARARQFSSFILLVGKVAAADRFEPTDAIIIKDKDDLTIPLLLETIPTPKEFADAIESLSPEQQRFCQAFRSMQLASTLFGVVIIQIKPQMEKLLNLPNDALTKEIQMTQELMDLFIEYQVPSDLLSYDGPGADGGVDGGGAGGGGDGPVVGVEAKVERVKVHVAAVRGVIQREKDKELEEAAMREQKARMEARAMEPMQMREGGRGGGGGRGGKGGKGGGMSKSRMMKKGGGASRMQLATKAARKSAPQMDTMSVATMSVAMESKSAAAPAEPARQNDADKAKQPQQPKAGNAGDDAAAAAAGGDEDIDYTQIPALLDARFQTFDEDNCLRSTIIKPAQRWILRSQAGLLSEPVQSTLGKDEIKTKRNAAFDLLDALSRSGVLTIDFASLHVVLAATHCFDKSLINTVVQGNVNPIEKTERSSLIMASAIHDKSAAELVKDAQVPRLALYSSKLMDVQP